MSRLRYQKPANGNWEEALPIGSGKIGAMVFGEAMMEHYQINEDSVWYGGPNERVNPDAKPNLEKVRNLVFDGKISEAEQLLKYAFTAAPQSESPYQSLGDFYMDLMGTISEVEYYERELDLSTAIHTVKVKDKKSGITFTREVFASAVENCIITRVSADQPGSICAGVTMSRSVFYDRAWHDEDSAYMAGNLGKDGVDYCAGIRMVAKNAKVEALGEHLIAKNADSIMVFLTAGTTFREKNLEEEIQRCLLKVSKKSYEQLKAEHIAEYQSYFNQVRLELAYDKELDLLTTDERLSRINEVTNDNGLIQTYFDFGRYLLISCSRPGSLPANLQGIWNQDFNPAWGSKYTININTEMNYWPSEMFGLGECHMPLFDMLERMAVRGEKTAQDMYMCRGFVAHHNTDLWADTAPQDMYTPATIWPMGGAWLCTHVWMHFEYTRDLDFLKRMYPVLRKNICFFLDYLVSYDGKYVTNPSVSPENTYILPNGERGCVCFAPAMDSQILHDVFSQFISIVDIVGVNDEMIVSKVKFYLCCIPEISIGRHGQIMEWMYDYEEAEPGHRHISHLYALHPSNQIVMGKTPELIEAAKATLTRRLAGGGGHTGWSRAWIMNMYARLWEGDECYKHLLLLLKQSTLTNLLDNHPPFQIDGNFGTIAAIGEMLLQSEEDRVVILPALPTEWKEGNVKRIRVRGGAEVSIEWKNGALVKVFIKSSNIFIREVLYQDKRCEINMSEGEVLVLSYDDFC